MNTFCLREAAQFLRVHPEELRRRAKAGQIPGAKVGRAWVFLEDDLAEYLRSLYSQPRQALQVTLRKEMECHFANAAVSGGVAPIGERIRRTAGTANKVLAQEFHDRLKSELWRIAHLGEKPRRTWNEAVVRWLKEQSHKATAGEDVTKLRWLDQFLGGHTLDTITRSQVDKITDAKLAQGLSNATVNRTLELLRAILRKSVNDWEWLERAPHIRMLREPTRRIRFLSRDEAQRLLSALPDHLADMAGFSLQTGLRASNVTGLLWAQVDVVRRLAWVHPDQAKARKAIPVPLNADAVAVIRKRLGRHATHVFSYRGKTITQVSTKAWYAALREVGIEDFRWHDLRHTWASWHVQNGTPLFALQEMGVGRVRRWCGGMRTSLRIT